MVPAMQDAVAMAEQRAATLRYLISVFETKKP
jgi:hypothetical protein